MNNPNTYKESLESLLICIGNAEKEIREHLATVYIHSDLDPEDKIEISTLRIIDDDDFLYSNDTNITRTFDRLYDLRKLVIDILNTNDLDIQPSEIFHSHD